MQELSDRQRNGEAVEGESEGAPPVPPVHRAAQQPSEEAIQGFNDAMARLWNPVCLSSELTDEPRLVTLLERQLAIARLDGKAVAFDDVCCHLGAALSRGDIIGGNRLRCGYHGWTYDCTGTCVDIPGRGDHAIPHGARVRTYATTEKYGLVWVSLTDEPLLEIPDYPEYYDDEFHKAPPIRHLPSWRSSATRSVMAGLDDSHFPWVHDGTLADVDNPKYPQRRGDAVWIENGVLHSDYEIEMPDNPEAGGGNTGEWRMTRTISRATPNTLRLTLFAQEGTYILFNAFLPVAYNHTDTFVQMARMYDKDPKYDEKYYKFNHNLKEEDRSVLEGQRPWMLPPLAARLNLYVRPADLPLIRYQQWMEKLGIPQI